MARTPTFDRDAVARAARAVFWSNGYEAASIPALELATGLSRSSIYNSFGSKRGLFDAAVANYLAEVVEPLLAPLRHDPVPPDAVFAYLEVLRQKLIDPGSMTSLNGCMLVSVAGSPIARDTTVARAIADYRDTMRSALANGIQAHAPNVGATEVGRLAAIVTGMVISALALARIAPLDAADTMTAAAAIVAEANKT
jgi:AcrR family transcriptional regulator